jgi:steroid 5-alpha reductase family enzyme
MFLLTTFIFAVGFNLALFLPAYFFRTDKLTDISYALTFIILALYGLFAGGVTPPKLLVVALVVIWAIRLGAYLLYRIHKMGRDKRFDERRNNFLSFGSFWLLQGVTVWVVLISTLLFLQSENPSLTWLSFVGILIWLFGLSVESLADWQKFQFISNKANKGKWIDSGVWRYSRHPNYFGEILVWVGVYLTVVSALSVSAGLLGLLSPAYIALLLLFVSGVPLLEKSADKKWGDNPEYQEYKRKTSVLVLWPRR